MIKKYKSITAIALLRVTFFQFNSAPLIYVIGDSNGNNILYTPNDFVNDY